MQRFNPLSLWSDRGEFIEFASISSVLGPRLNPGINRSTDAGHRVTVQVVGHDLPNLVQGDYPKWREILREWLVRGVRIECVALGDPESIEESLVLNQSILEELPPQGSNACGEFQILLPKAPSQLDPDSAEILSELRSEHFTSHFLLVLDEDDEQSSQMWLEGEHLPKATSASRCYYYGENEAFLSPEFAQHRTNFEFLKTVSRVAARVSDCVSFA